MNDSTKWMTIGKIVGAQGLKGELRVNPRSDFPERFTKPGQRWLQRKNEPPVAIEILGGRQLPGKSLYIIRISKVNDRNAAEALLGTDLVVPSNSRPNLAKNEFHLMDLVGLKVKLNENTIPIGVVKDLLTAGNDLLEIELNEGKQVLVPFVQAIVPIVNLQEGWILITPPPGLLEL